MTVVSLRVILQDLDKKPMFVELARQVRLVIIAFMAAVALQFSWFLELAMWIYAPGLLVMSLFPKHATADGPFAWTSLAFYTGLGANIVFWWVVIFFSITTIDSFRRRKLKQVA